METISTGRSSEWVNQQTAEGNPVSGLIWANVSSFQFL
jgi:hypothetical protein